tara:strand:+ start:422 stop:592 length:171 start_codon:yes stop_codon:yes gene_type:complete
MLRGRKFLVADHLNISDKNLTGIRYCSEFNVACELEIDSINDYPFVWSNGESKFLP